MAYNLKTTRTAFVGGKNILASEHVQFLEAGATIKGGEGLLEVGQLIARLNGAQPTHAGKFVKYIEANVATYDEFGILNVDVDATTYDAIVGEVIVRGSVYEAKLPQAPTAGFKGKLPMVRFVKHV
jgi:hypothetical protein